LENNEEVIDENSPDKEDLKFLIKAFKKWTPHILSSPYIPTPTIMIKPTEDIGVSLPKETNLDNPTITSPSEFSPGVKYFGESEKYDNIIDYLHKGAVAYSVGDYGTAINYFLRLLEINWLKHSSYFYLIKTLIKLDIEKEMISAQTKSKNNNVRMTK
jgi:hypothetical protein